MEIRESNQGDVLVLVPDGSVTVSEETKALETKLRTVLKAGARLVVIDCTAVGHLTSDAVRVLLMTSQRLDRKGGRVVLCGMNAKLKKAFSISGIDKDFLVAATLDEAVQRAVEAPGPRPSREAQPVPATPAANTPIVAVAVVDEAVAPDPLEALASGLLDALGVHAPASAVIPFGDDARAGLDRLANTLLAGLRPGGV